MATIELAKEAIEALDEKNGSSVTAISKWLENEKEITAKRADLSAMLKEAVESGELVKVRSSYKLPSDKEDEEKPAKKETKKKAETKKAAPKKKKTKAKKKTPTKKSKKSEEAPPDDDEGGDDHKDDDVDDDEDE